MGGARGTFSIAGAIETQNEQNDAELGSAIFTKEVLLQVGDFGIWR